MEEVVSEINADSLEEIRVGFSLSAALLCSLVLPCWLLLLPGPSSSREAL